jgi:O-antigen/teichoic acid export membrane protein
MQGYQLLRVGSAVLVGVLLAKSGLSVADIGTWETLMYLGSTVVFLGVNALLQGIAPVYAGLDASRQAGFLRQVTGVFWGLALLVFGLFFFGKTWLVPALTGLPEVPYFGWYCLYLLLHLPSLPVEIVYLVRERPLHIVAWGVVGFGVQMLVVMLPIGLGWGLGGSVAGLVGLAILRLGWAWWLVGLPDVSPFFSKKNTYPALGQYLALAAPLVANGMLGQLAALFDQWLVGWHYADAAVFAVWRYGSREFPLALALATGLGTALVLRIGQDAAAGQAELRRRGTRLMHLVFPISIGLMLSADWLFPRVFNADFAAAAPVFRIFLLVTATRLLLPTSVLLGLGDSRSIFRVGVLELFLKVVLGFVFIGWWGLEGVAWSVVVCHFFEKISLAAWLWYRHRVAPAAWLHVGWYGVYVLLLFGAFGWVR